MNRFKLYSWLLVFSIALTSCGNDITSQNVSGHFQPTEDSSKPWVYWYWMKSAYSKEGITADLEAMKQAGIRGAYLMTIKGPDEEPLMNPPVVQLSKEFWDLVKWAMMEADRLGLKIAFHAADGFAVAGGPWITPDISMQKVVWSDTIIFGADAHGLKLPVPEHYKDFYEEIVTYAVPTSETFVTSEALHPKVTASTSEVDASFLTSKKREGTQFKLYEKGWVQYEFNTPFTCKSIQVETKGNNYQAHRLIIEASSDGKHFTSLGRLEAPRQGWQDTDAFYTHSIVPTTARYFRFVYDPEGTEPGAEDLDAAKWKQSLKVTKIILSNMPKIDNYQGKSGAVWRLSSNTTAKQIGISECLERSKMINISEYINDNGYLNWNAPKGSWRILRFGHTSTGHENATGGAGKGLEVDKFNPEAIRFQLDQWFGECRRVAGEDLATRVMDILHLDSWECGSQNWSSVFQKEFKTRRGYDIVDFLPVMAGIPVDNIETSEQVLHDVRQTISELISDNFFGTLADLSKEAKVKFSSENVAPTMMSDGLLHFKHVDYPGGEFWFRSPTHDKPNDMLDAISGGHIYGKDIIQAEAFTQLRMDWDEHPGVLKTMADRNYALGINRFFYHVFVHNPWLDRKPGMTLDGIGTYFQRDQTWWEPGKAFFDYCQRVQFQLQHGQPVIDLAVFIGEELPSRSVLPDRLVASIPNVFGEQRLESERIRLKNEGQPSATMPKEVNYSKNLTELSQWVNALNGYKYDSFNADVLLNDAHVKNGCVSFRGGIQYKALLFPGVTKMSPNNSMSLKVAEKILELVKAGATVMVAEKPEQWFGYQPEANKQQWQKVIDAIWSGQIEGTSSWNLGKGKVVQLPYLGDDFKTLGFSPDLKIAQVRAQYIAWTHRKTTKEEVYFIANQLEQIIRPVISFRISGKVPYFYYPLEDKTEAVKQWSIVEGRTEIPMQLNKNESVFVIFKENTSKKGNDSGVNWAEFNMVKTLNEGWTLQFDPAFHGPEQPLNIQQLFDWTTSEDNQVKYYSGTAAYTKTFNWNGETDAPIWLHLGEVNNLAEVILNGQNCGVNWTYPKQLNISKALKQGENTLVIKVTNTWANRLIGDHNLPEEERLTWTTAPYRLEGNPLSNSGLLGPVVIIKEK